MLVHYAYSVWPWMVIMTLSMYSLYMTLGPAPHEAHNLFWRMHNRMLSGCFGSVIMLTIFIICSWLGLI